ncbi:NUDIX domain-containing protein [Streptomyces sp. ITFR-16]|uniref:NUDIX hydrolase n=1 Tax=Streptomyces sp. ITFR-16 TaxID=3075198 RepID=UPI00288B271A|nr:NUDIX domain-containing protein [Streptomyces sp. ITFR-16]WNI20529.1 NUDIX domain-containing protein [Streptomyces sp. ITFR-16]
MTTPVPALAVRTCAVIVEGGEICLIRRTRPGGDQYSLPCGLLQPDEEVPAGLARELREELDLDVTALPELPQLRWAQDQITTRPGRPGTFRRLHLIHLLHLPLHVRTRLPATEQDADDETDVVWVGLWEAATCHLYPHVGEVLGRLAVPGSASGPVLLPPITDRTYSWR